MGNIRVVTSLESIRLTLLKVVNRKRFRPDIPIILCSGCSEGITDEKTKEMGIKVFAMKPIVRKDVAKSIREVLDK